MAASLQIGNGWQSPRISFPLDFPQAETERTTNDWQSPRISFSRNLSQTDRLSPEKQKREAVADVSYDTDFEFCVISNNNNGGRNSITGESHLAVAEELFLDGKILPVIHGPVEAQPVTIARRHVSLESLRCQSPVRSTSSPPSKITSSWWRNVASKSLRHKPPIKWKETMLKLSNRENDCADNRRTSYKVVDQLGNNLKQQPSSTKSSWSFSMSCRTGEEMKGNSLFRSLPFSRSHSTAERKYKAATSGCPSKEIEILPSLVEGSKPLEAWSISNKVQPERRFPGQLKPTFEAGEGKAETKAKQYTAGRDKLGSPGLPASRMRAGMIGQRSSGRVSGKGKLTVRNSERSSSTAAKAASLNSPPPGKPMAEGYFLPKANNSVGGGVRVSPVVNVPMCIGHAGGRWNRGGGIFGFFSKTEKEQPQPSEYHRHRSHASTNRKRGT